jgi:methylmalonyl-CoA mutase
VNLLRNTAATFAGAIGGADILTPLPYDAALGVPDADARRLARNTVHLLEHEAQLARVADVAAGSHAIESWTEALAARAWGLAQAIEEQGGFEAALASGFVAARVAQTRQEEAARLARRQDGLVGTSLFPNLDEVRPLRAAPAPAGVAPRLAEPVERLRAAGEARGQRAVHDTRGAPAEHLARLGFAKGFYELAGIRTVEIADGPALADEIRAAGATLAVVCGSDRAYPDAVPRLAPALAAAGIQRVVVAGRPGEREAAYRAAGVHAFIHLGLNVLEVFGGPGAPGGEDAR